MHFFCAHLNPVFSDLSRYDGSQHKYTSYQIGIDDKDLYLKNKKVYKVGARSVM